MAYKSKKIAKVGDKVTLVGKHIYNRLYDIPLIIVGENEKIKLENKKSIISKITHHRGKNKGSQTLTLSPIK